MKDHEITRTVTTHTAAIPAHITRILKYRATLSAEAERYQIVQTLDDAEFTINAGSLPRWEYHPTSEQLQARNGSPARYMYLYWSRDRYSRKYRGPKGQRKTYVGAKPARQSLARSLDKNLQDWEVLQHYISDHSYKLNRALGALGTASDIARQLVNDMATTIEEFTAERD